jgi:hypothetical protein
MMIEGDVGGSLDLEGEVLARNRVAEVQPLERQAAAAFYQNDSR